MTTTQPPAPRTGQGHPQCFAAGLLDCGKADRPTAKIEREHYISECLLEQIRDHVVPLSKAGRFTVEGFTRGGGIPIAVVAGSMTAGILCPRHNRALSPVDYAICRLYDVLKAFHAGDLDAWHEFDGDDLERWAIKALCGALYSGNVLVPGREGERVEVVPVEWLRVLFDEDDVREGCGFYFSFVPEHMMDPDNLRMEVLMFPPDDEEAGMICGITTRLLGFRFTTTVLAKLESKERTWHRPIGFKLGEQGGIRLRWKRTSSTEILNLSRTTPTKNGTP